MFAQTVSVNILLDELYINNPVYGAQHFKMLEVDGYYLVIVEQINKLGDAHTVHKCFIQEEDAFGYLEMYGIERQKEEPAERTHYI